MHGENTNQILRCEKCDYTTNIQENLARHLKTVGLYNFAILIKLEWIVYTTTTPGPLFEIEKNIFNEKRFA